MSFDVRLSRSAERYLERLPRDTQRRIVGRLTQLAEDPFEPYTKPLQGAPFSLVNVHSTSRESSAPRTPFPRFRGLT